MCSHQLKQWSQEEPGICEWGTAESKALRKGGADQHFSVGEGRMNQRSALQVKAIPRQNPWETAEASEIVFLQYFSHRRTQHKPMQEMWL